MGAACTMRLILCPVAATASRRRARSRAYRPPSNCSHSHQDSRPSQMLSRHFGMLPRSILQDAVLCVGRMTLQWRGLGQSAGLTGSAATQSHSQFTSLHAFTTGAVQSSNTVMGPAASSSSARATRAARVHAREEHDLGYAGDMSSAASSPDDFECSVRAILPMLARVTMPTPQPKGRFGLDELIARGGVPLSTPGQVEGAALDDGWDDH